MFLDPDLPVRGFDKIVPEEIALSAISRHLGIDYEKLNVHGGAVALGHPIGASGCRVLVTMLYEMIRQDKKTGLATLCLGGGEAVAMIVKR